jgi:hypothetical protein
MSEKARVLVVANRTAASDELLEALVKRIERGAAEFFLVVPATPRGATPTRWPPRWTPRATASSTR